jgi:hypothetical protein
VLEIKALRGAGGERNQNVQVVSLERKKLKCKPRVVLQNARTTLRYCQESILCVQVGHQQFQHTSRVQKRHPQKQIRATPASGNTLAVPQLQFEVTTQAPASMNGQFQDSFFKFMMMGWYLYQIRDRNPTF